MQRMLIAALLALAGATAVYATGSADRGAAPDAGREQGRAALAEGEIRRIDREAKKVTIRHGPLRNLDMPAMTMVFKVKDAAILDRLQPGDKVHFEAEKIGAGYVVTRMEPAR